MPLTLLAALRIQKSYLPLWFWWPLLWFWVIKKKNITETCITDRVAPEELLIPLNKLPYRQTSMALKGGKVPLEDDSTSSSDGATPAPGSVPSTYDVISLSFWIFLFNKWYILCILSLVFPFHRFFRNRLLSFKSLSHVPSRLEFHWNLLSRNYFSLRADGSTVDGSGIL